MAAPLRPRALTWRGVVEAQGLWWGFRFCAPAEARRRALALWRPGALVYAWEDGLALVWGAPRALRAEVAPGAALVRARGSLCAAPLAPEEWAALALPAGAALVLVRGGEARARALDPGALVDPAAWVSLRALVVPRLEGLGEPPPAPRAPAAPPRLRLREGLGLDSEAAAAQRAALERAIERARQGLPAAPGALAPRDGWWLRLARWLGEAPAAPQGGLLGRIGGWLPSGGGATAPRATVRVRLAPRDASAAPGLVERLRGWVQARGQEVELQRALGAQQAQFLQETLEMFDRGDLREALLRAIPVSSAPGAEAGASGAFLGALGARGALEISGAGGGGGGAVVTPLHERLREAYRAAAERLIQEGQIEEAAFVLLELLGQTEEGLALLEKHARWEMAAQVALARALPPGRCAALLARSGDWDGALRLARASGCYGQTDTFLAPRGKDASEDERAPQRRWRLGWANALARGGDFAPAVELAWEIPAARKLALAWNDHLIQRGGPAAGRALARKVALTEEEGAADAAGRAAALLRDGEAARGEERHGFCAQLAELPAGEARARLLPLAARSALRDGLARPHARNLALLRGLGAACPDPLLAQELALLALTGRASAPPDGERFVFAAHDAGALEVRAVTRSPGGALALGLGEAGVALLDARGRVRLRDPAPIEAFVSATHGGRALGLARRGRALQIYQIDLERGRCDFWCEAPLDAWAASYDGLTWLVAQGEQLLAVDTLVRGGALEAIWRAPALPGRARLVAWSPRGAAALIQHDAPEIWRFDVPAMTLRARTPGGAGAAAATALTPGGVLARALGPDGDGPQRVAIWADPGPDKPPALISLDGADGAREPWLLALSEACAVVGARRNGEVLIWALALKPARTSFYVSLQGARGACAHLDEDVLTLADDRGRVLAFSLAERELLSALRV
jgi:hypothetical protein